MGIVSPVLDTNVVLAVADQAPDIASCVHLKNYGFTQFVIIPYAPEDILFDVLQCGERIAGIVAGKGHQHELSILDECMCLPA